MLTLFGYLFARPGSLLLIDEPDAHLHVILQEVVWSRLRRLAAATRSQLIVATHAETFIDAVAPEELCLCYQRPRLLRDAAERDRLTESLRSLSNVDLMLAGDARGVLYTEDWTDLEILRAWSRALNHPLASFLEQGILWKAKTLNLREGCAGIDARDHHAALRLVRDDLPALELVDGDAHPGLQSKPVTGQGFQRLRWRRYEIESYLFHPTSLARFIAKLLGVPEDSPEAAPHIRDMQAWIADNLPPAVVREPLGEHEVLNNMKARTKLIPPILDAAGFPGLPYTRFAEIAAVMRAEEIHPEVHRETRLDPAGVRPMSNFEVPEPILNSPYDEPLEHWWIIEGQPLERRSGRRPAMYYYREPGRDQIDKGGYHIELKRVNLIRERVKAWRAAGLAGRDADHARPARLLAARRPDAAVVLCPVGSRRDDYLPVRSAGGLPAGTRDPPRRAQRRGAGQRLQRLSPLRQQDGHRVGQDDRHGDARRVEHLEQGQQPQRRAVFRRGAGGLPERHHPRPAARVGPGARRGEPVPDARPGARPSAAATGAGQGAGHQLARLRAADARRRRATGAAWSRRACPC